MKDMALDSTLVQSLLRGLEILSLLSLAEDGLTVRELGEELGLKQPTVYKLLQTLVAAGYAEKTQRPVRYRLGAGAYRLVAQHEQRLLLQQAAETVERLFEEFREERATVVLTEALAGEVEVVLRMSPERPGVLERPRGRVMSPYGSACSLAFQALWTERERREYQRRHPFWEEGVALWGTPEALEEQLQAIRVQGYATPGIKSRQVPLVAVPVYGRHQQLVAVLGVSLPEAEQPPVNWAEKISRVVAAGQDLTASE
jgi:DNA-binding IclR family transcriptional regulator